MRYVMPAKGGAEMLTAASYLLFIPGLGLKDLYDASAR